MITVRSRCLLLAAVLMAGACSRGIAERKPDTFEARKKLARELIGRQDWAGAFFYADQLHRERPDDAEVLALRGVVYRERGLPGEAEADFKKALELNDELPDAHAALGILYDMSARGQQAEPHHRRAATLVPANPAYLNNLGFSLFLRGKYRDAVREYQRAVRLDPTNRRLRTNLGFALAASGDLPRAAKEFEMGGSPAEARNNLGFAYERGGNLVRAFDCYQEALRLDPRSTRARANLVHVARKLGKELPSDLAKEDDTVEGSEQR